MIGQTLGHYEILRKLGEGGMGVVYLAADKKLERNVALKVLPVELAESPDRLERFTREAKALAALDHPNIVHLYSVEREEDVHFFTMQVVDGKPLSKLIPPSGMPAEQFFEIAIPLADALATTHEQGIVHRDLKPGNVMLTEKGQVKVLDFGLAKQRPLIERKVDSELSTEPYTDEGQILGTIPYMSPEQLEGNELDPRSDIFSLGVILHEMATGKRPFRGDGPASLISSIMKDTPPEVDTIREELPHHLARIIRHCLEKDPQRRFQSALDVRNELHDLRNEVHTTPGSASSKSPVEARGTSHRVTNLKAALVLLLVLASLSAGAWFWMTTKDARHGARLGETDQLLLTDFINRTDDPVFDGTLSQALAIKLEESPFLSIFPRSKVQETLELMGRNRADAVTPDIGREVCRRQGIKAMVTGEITALGSNYVVSLAAAECQEATTLSRELVEVQGKENVLSALGEAATRIRRDLGESLATIERFDAPVEQATTASLEALKNMSLAESTREEGRRADSIPLFQRALEIDPEFALAHARLGTVYSNIGELEKAIHHKSRAYELRDRVSERERLYITAHYFGTVTGEMPRVIETYRAFKRLYPRFWLPANNLCSLYNDSGWYERAVEECEVALGLNPDHPLPYSNLAMAYLALGELARARDTIEEALGYGYGSGGLYQRRFDLAYLENNRAELEEVASSVAGHPEESQLLLRQAGGFASEGRLAEAERLVHRAIDSAIASGFAERPASHWVNLARWNAAFGRLGEAAEFAETALEIAANRGSLPSAAIVFAMSGATERTEQILEELSLRYPTDTYIQSVWVPLAAASLAMSRKDPEAGLDALEAARPYERSNLIVPLLRGQALLKLDRPAEAAVEFQKIVDLPGVTPTAPLHTLARLGLGRARMAHNELEASERGYREFLGLVGDADAGLPEIEAAQQEHSALLARMEATGG